MQSETKPYATKKDREVDPTRALDAADIQPLGSSDRKRLESAPPDSPGIKAVGGKILVPPKRGTPIPQPPQNYRPSALGSSTILRLWSSVSQNCARFLKKLLHTQTSMKLLKFCGISTPPSHKVFWLIGAFVLAGFLLGLAVAALF
ncbi:MAG: hypothetical protein IPJ88_06570 [Myxococcales bacterium]|nr:MAG: hypothetical protein IPJ88_06570 [Myxococcales bacterium]